MWIVHYMRWIMLVSGALTATMVQAAIAPDAALQSNFGETVSGPLAQLVVRNWGALIALVGGMLIYGAFNPLQRSLVLIVAGASKVIFIALVLSEGTRYLSFDPIRWPVGDPAAAKEHRGSPPPRQAV